MESPLSWRHTEGREGATGEDHQCIMGEETIWEGLRQKEARSVAMWLVWLPMDVMQGDAGDSGEDSGPGLVGCRGPGSLWERGRWSDTHLLMYSPVRMTLQVWHLKQLTCHCLSSARSDWPCLISSLHPAQSAKTKVGHLGSLRLPAIIPCYGNPAPDAIPPNSGAASTQRPYQTKGRVARALACGKGPRNEEERTSLPTAHHDHYYDHYSSKLILLAVTPVPAILAPLRGLHMLHCGPHLISPRSLHGGI